MSTQRPNLFRYGHKELSQDAMICWLLDWANERYKKECPALHEAGQRFARALFAKHGRPGPRRIETVKLGMQVASIDVLAWVDGEYALLIEDKTDSGRHGGQLKRYHEKALGGSLKVWDETADKSDKWVPVIPTKDKLFPIFLKTGNMSRAEKRVIEGIELSPPYRVFERQDFLDVLKGCDLRASEILAAFHDHLAEKESRTCAYKCAPLRHWPWEGWEGLFRCLEENLEVDGWRYVPNPSGGFLGLWWHWRNGGGDDVHLQIEWEKLCFKIEVGDAERRSERRRYWHDRIVAAGKAAGMKIAKPARFGSGYTMTVARLVGDDGWEDRDWRQAGIDGRLDLAATLDVLRQAEKVLDAAVDS